MLEVKKYLPLFLVCLLACALLAWPAQEQQTQWEHIQVTVRTGDTVWGLAEHFKSEQEDIRAVVSRIYETNKLAGQVLRPGQNLIVPIPKKAGLEILAKAE